MLAILCSFSNADQNNDGLINDLLNDFISDENYDAPTDSGKNITDLEIVSTYIILKMFELYTYLRNSHKIIQAEDEDSENFYVDDMPNSNASTAVENFDENYDVPTDSGKNFTDLEIVSTYIDSKKCCIYIPT